MPRIPDYSSRLGLPETAGTVPVPVGPAVLPAEAAAKGFGQVADIGNRIDSELTRAAIASGVSKATADASVLLNDMRNRYLSSPEFNLDPEKAMASFKDEVENLRQSTAKTIGDGQARAIFDEHFNKLAGSHVITFSNDVRKARINLVQGETLASVDSFTQAAAAAPNDALYHQNIASLYGGIDAAVASGAFPADFAQRLKESSTRTAIVSRGEAAIQKDPYRFLSDIENIPDGSPWNHLKELDRVRLQEQAQNKIKVFEREQEHLRTSGRVLLQERMKSALTEMETNGSAPGGIVDEVATSYDENHAVLFRNQLDNARKLHGVTQELVWMPPEEATIRIEEMKPQAGDPDYHNKFQVYSNVQRRAQQMQKAYEADPVAYVSSSPLVKQAPEAQKLDAILSVQKSMGSREDQFRILSDQQASSVVAQFNSSPGSKRIEIVQGLKAKFGSHWDMALRDLVATKKFDAMNQVLANVTNPAVAPVVASAIDQGEKPMKELLGAKKVKEIDDVVTSESGEWFKTHALAAFDGSRSKWASEVIQAVKMTAYVYAQRGISPGESAERAVKEILTGDLHPIGNDTYLVPKVLDKAKVDRYGDLMKKRLGESQGFEVFPTSKEIIGQWGKRSDGSPKGLGYFGALKNSAGGISTELSLSIEFDGKEMEIPSLVPTLTGEEVRHLLNGGKPTEEIMEKAVAFARERIANGKSPFAEKGEQSIPPSHIGFGFLYPTDVREGVTMDQAREDYLSATRRRGYWVNNESGNGLVLIDPRGIPVIDGSGNRYEFTFEDAMKYAPPEPAAGWEWPLPFSGQKSSSKQSPFSGEVMGRAQQYGVPERLALGVHLAEWNPKQRVSSAGAIGEMQLMPGTARDLGVNPNNSSENIDGGVRYLKQMLDRYGGDITRALVAYNWGPANADKWGGSMKSLPAETRNYIATVRRYMG